MPDRDVGVARVDVTDIGVLRTLFLQESNFQVRYHAYHARGWSDSYAVQIDGVTVGYASLKADSEPGMRDTVFEYYVEPPFRRQASVLFAELLSASRATRIECQSNDAFLSAMLFEFASGIQADVVLFEPHAVISRPVSGVTVRRRQESDRIFEHAAEPEGDFVAELDGEIVATGGFLTHYNPPFADLYMEVQAEHRRKGIGAFLVAEVVRECYAAGRVPSARCDIGNVASRATLTSAGMRTCGFMLRGEIGLDR